MKINSEKKLLYDGNSKEFYIDGILIEYSSNSFKFKANEIRFFSQLLKMFSEQTIAHILNVTQSKKRDNLNSFQSYDGFSLGFIQKYDVIFIIAFDEIQHSRYRVCLEGIITDYSNDLLIEK